MPKIPLYSPQQTMAGASPAYQPVSGDIAAREIGKFGEALAEFGSMREEWLDAADVQNAFLSWRDTVRGKREEIIDNRQGGNARGVSKEFGTWYDKEAGVISDKLRNGRQRIKFAQLVEDNRNSSLEAMAGYERSETEKWRKDTVRRQLVTAEEDVAENPNNIPDVIEAYGRQVEDLYPGRPEITEVLKADAKVRLTTQAIKSLASTDPDMAREMLASNANTPLDHNALASMIDREENKIIIESTYKAAADLYPDDFDAQRDAVKEMDGLTEAQKRSVYAWIHNDEVVANAKEKKRADDTEQAWFDMYARGELTEQIVRDDAYDFMPVSTRNAWVSRVKDQINGLKREANQENADLSNETYAMWMERADLEFNDWNPADVYKDIAPNDGGLTAPMAATIVDRIMRNRDIFRNPAIKAETKQAKEATASIKRQIAAMHDRGDFGDLASKKGKATAKTIKAEHILALEDWVQSNPGKDPTEWFESYADLKAAERAASSLNNFFETIIPGGENKKTRIKKLASGDMDESIARRMIIEKGYDVSRVTDQQILDVIKTREFNLYKTRMLTEQ